MANYKLFVYKMVSPSIDYYSILIVLGFNVLSGTAGDGTNVTWIFVNFDGGFFRGFFFRREY